MGEVNAPGVHDSGAGGDGSEVPRIASSRFLLSAPCLVLTLSVHWPQAQELPGGFASRIGPTQPRAVFGSRSSLHSASTINTLALALSSRKV